MSLSACWENVGAEVSRIQAEWSEQCLVLYLGIIFPSETEIESLRCLIILLSAHGKSGYKFYKSVAKDG